ncbi:transforming growth factor beta activator LRRC32-like [Conger conger]|uniref:transforming growth factor beta activator LRRC32-like n=1 Tax=Conger conger TaxID=82655 RepID=UPI002A5A4374|nr:transforming growth factor beta activator LRRC32-like [Conger conger]
MVAAAFLCVLLALWSGSRGDSSAFHKARGTSSTPPGCVKVNLEKLSCSNLNLTSVPARVEPGLRRLDVSNNRIRDTGVLDLRSLQELDASGNGLRFLHEGTFQGMFRLRTLILAGNALNEDADSSSVAFWDLLGLHSLDMSSNGLNDSGAKLYLDKIYSLNHLKLAGNALTKLTSSLFSRSHLLRSLDVENNLILDIEEGTFEALKRLAWLNLAGNNLACICDFRLHGLKFLNLSRNSIEFFLTHYSNDSYQLEKLDLSYNSLLYFPMLPKINKLRYLHLQNNKLGILVPERSILEASSLYEEIHYGTEGSYEMYSDQSLELLAHLDLSNNQLTSFPSETLSYLPSLEALNMSSNCLHGFGHSAIQKNGSQSGAQKPELLPSLRSLDLQRNQIRSLGLAEALPEIETLNLWSNLVNPCPGNQSEPLQPRNTSGAPCVSFSTVKTLRHLNLGENGIKTLFPHTFQHTPLVSLDLSGNQAMTMVGGALEGLQGTLELLSISGNEMQSSDLSLQCFGVLRRLDLAWNRLEVLPDSLGCSPLRELDLRHNDFALLDEHLLTWPASRLEAVFVSGNAFNCCTAGWLENLRGAKVRIPDLDEATCFYSRNGAMSARSLSDYYKLCHPRPKLVITIVTLLTASLVSLIIIIILLLVKGGSCKKCSSLNLKSNKVASIQYCNNEQSAVPVAKINMYDSDHK